MLRQNLGVFAHCCIMENPSLLLLPKIQLPEQLGSGHANQAVNMHKQPQHTLRSSGLAQNAQMAVLLLKPRQQRRSCYPFIQQPTREKKESQDGSG